MGHRKFMRGPHDKGGARDTSPAEVGLRNGEGAYPQSKNYGEGVPLRNFLGEGAKHSENLETSSPWA